MSQPPPYRGAGSPAAIPPPNPDTRPLPPGWTEQYDWNYKQWFYVNTRDDPPRSSWVHPLGALPPTGYAPPPGPPPGGDRGWGGASPYAQGPPAGYGGGYAQPPPRSPYGAGGYGGPPVGYGGPPPAQYGYQQESRGWFGGPSPQPQTVQVVESRPARSGGMGTMGTALLAGGAGLVGGALLEDAFENHDEEEREEGFQDGYQDGVDQDYGGDGGGDW